MWPFSAPPYPASSQPRHLSVSFLPNHPKDATRQTNKPEHFPGLDMGSSISYWSWARMGKNLYHKSRTYAPSRQKNLPRSAADRPTDATTIAGMHSTRRLYLAYVTCRAAASTRQASPMNLKGKEKEEESAVWRIENRGSSLARARSLGHVRRVSGNNF